VNRGKTKRAKEKNRKTGTTMKEKVSLRLESVRTVRLKKKRECWVTAVETEGHMGGEGRERKE